MNETLQAAMVFAKAEFLSDLRSILAIGIGPDGQMDSSLVCDLATVQFDETQDRLLDLSKAAVRQRPFSSAPRETE
jgi:hypothetical protein